MDHPIHEPDQYDVVSEDGAVLQLSDTLAASWITLDLKSRRAVIGYKVNVPAEEDPEALDTVIFTVWRGVMATSAELGRFGKRR
jgi:hypothetical protein